MKRMTILLFCVFTIALAHGQQKAVTETGKEVILFDDGTWKYQNPEDVKESEIATNPGKFVKDVASTFMLKSSKVNVGLWINPKTWSFKKATDNQDAEYELQLKEGDLYGMVIAEKVEVPLETLKAAALDNARKVAPDLQLIKEEFRTVNGIRVLLLEMHGTMQGVKFAYYGYYFSNINGTIQVITYTSQNLLDRYKPECERLLNGLVELK